MKRIKCIVVVVSIALTTLFFLNPDAALGQVSYGVFRGQVTDASGAAIPHASVTATSQTRGFTKTVTADASGNYEIGGIQPDTYTLTAKAKGFKQFVNTNVILYPHEIRQVPIRLEVGAITQTVTVTEKAPVVQTQGASLSITRPESWETFQPGSRSQAGMPEFELFKAGQQGHFAIGGGGASFIWINHGANGREMRANMDGVQDTNLGNFRAPQFSFKETKLWLVDAPAEFQTSGTAQAVTRGGTNQLHGTVLLQVTNNDLQALGPTPTTRPPGAPSHEWEISVGGPVYIPKLYDGRNRTFWNFLAHPVTNESSSVARFIYPTAAMRQGDLSIFGTPIKDPTTGQPFQNAQIPADRIDPVAAKLLQLYVPTPTAETLAPNFAEQDAQNSQNRDYNFRVDQKIGERNTVSVIYYRLLTESSSQFDWNPTDGGVRNHSGIRSISVEDSHTFGSRLVNEFQFSRLNDFTQSTDGNISGLKFLQSIGLTDLGGRTPPDSLGAPRVNVDGFGPLNGLGNNLVGRSQGISDTNDISYSVSDNVTYLRGRHTLKGGFQMQDFVPNQLAVGGNAWGTYNFDGFATGNAFADLLLGIPHSTSITTPRGLLDEHHAEAGFFLQDEFKMTPHLTWNIGMRYQLFTVPTDTNGEFYNFDYLNKQVVVQNQAALQKVVPAWPAGIPIVTAQQAGYPSTLVDASWRGWEPRIGVAWQPWGDNFVVRVGYGLYHVPETSFFALAGRQSGPFQLSEAFGPTVITNGVPDTTFDSPFPSAPGVVGAQSLIAIPKGYKLPYTQQWNLTLERAVGFGFSARVSYVGSKGTQWRFTQNLQQPLPSTLPFSPDREPFGPASLYNTVLLAQNGGNMSYHALELGLTRKFSKGLYFQANFNWTKTLLDVFEGNQENGLTPTDSYNRALDKGEADGSEPILFTTNMVWFLPIGRGQRFLNFGSSKGSSVLNQIFGGWTISGTLVASAGYVYTPSYSGFDSTGTGISSGRPDALCSTRTLQRSATFWWDPSCFQVPSSNGLVTGLPLGRFGDAAKGSLRGPGYYLVDSGIFKDFQLFTTKDFSPRLRFSFLARNAFNHPAQGGLFGCNTSISGGAFGNCPFGRTPPYWAPYRQVWLTSQLVF